jgi:quercetin dioxygenase-like cupin family protein
MEGPMRVAIVVIGVCGVVGASAVGAQTQRVGAPARILQSAESAVPGYELVAVQAEFVPGASTGWHTHPGEMVGYVLEGSLVVEQEGRAPTTFAMGQAFTVPAGTPHVDTNRGRTHASMHAIYVVKKGEPLRSNVVR